MVTLTIQRRFNSMYQLSMTKTKAIRIRKVDIILTYPQIDDDCQDITPARGITAAIK